MLFLKGSLGILAPVDFLDKAPGPTGGFKGLIAGGFCKLLLPFEATRLPLILLELDYGLTFGFAVAFMADGSTD